MPESSLPTLELVAHVHRYERCLAYFASALHLFPPATCRVVATIFYAVDDRPVNAVLDALCDSRPGSPQPPPPNVAWNLQSLAPRLLCRRAIGRNRAALASRADWVLFVDIDYIPRHQALDHTLTALEQANTGGLRLCYPQQVMASSDHAAGDCELQRLDGALAAALAGRSDSLGRVDIDESLYSPKRLPAAIGGAQWVPGDVARRYGYLPDHPEFQQGAETWQRTREDPVYRQYLWEQAGIGQQPLSVDGWYRIRHGLRGREDLGCRN